MMDSSITTNTIPSSSSTSSSSTSSWSTLTFYHHLFGITLAGLFVYALIQNWHVGIMLPLLFIPTIILIKYRWVMGWDGMWCSIVCYFVLCCIRMCTIQHGVSWHVDRYLFIVNVIVLSLHFSHSIWHPSQLVHYLY